MENSPGRDSSTHKKVRRLNRALVKSNFYFYTNTDDWSFNGLVPSTSAARTSGVVPPNDFPLVITYDVKIYYYFCFSFNTGKKRLSRVSTRFKDYKRLNENVRGQSLDEQRLPWC